MSSAIASAARCSSATLAYMAARKDDRINSATFFAAQADFSEAGDLQIFIDDAQLEALEQQMEASGGVLEGSKMATTFNMLRANDLIWSFVVNNYLLGKTARAVRPALLEFRHHAHAGSDPPLLFAAILQEERAGEGRDDWAARSSTSRR